MLAALHTLQGRFTFEIRVVDVDSDPALDARYGERVPVLTVDERELCHYFLDHAAITAFFAEIR